MLEILFDNKKLCRMRRKNGLTQEQLSEKSDISDRYLRKLEKGGATPSATVLYSISHALNLPMESLIKINELPDELL